MKSPSHKNSTISLRDGRSVHLRLVRREDIACLRALDEDITRDGRGVVLALDELPTEQAIRDRIEARASAGGLWLVAGHADRLVGNIEVVRVPVRALRHNADLSMGVHPEFQGQGLGRQLLNAAITWCQSQSITRIDLSCLADNERALALYQSAGFEQVEVRRAFMRAEGKDAVDDIRLVCFLSPAAAANTEPFD